MPNLRNVKSTVSDLMPHYSTQRDLVDEQGNSRYISKYEHTD